MGGRKCRGPAHDLDLPVQRVGRPVAMSRARPAFARRRSVLAALGALGGAAAAAERTGASPAERADGAPPLRELIVPISAGSGSDVLARRLANLLEARTGTRFLVVNLPGAGGIVAAGQLLRSPPEEAALLLGNSGLILRAPLLAKPPPVFDTLRDLVPVALVMRAPAVLVASRSVPIRDLHELRSHARREGGTIQYACGDAGNAPHLAIETLLARLGIKGLHVAYRQLDQGVIDVVEGRVPVGCFNWQSVSAAVTSGRLGAIAVLGDERLAAAPSVATVPEQGFGAFDVKGWFGVFAARAVAPRVRAADEASLRAVLEDDTMQRFVRGIGYEPAYLGSAAAARFIAEDFARTRAVLERLRLL